MTAFINLAHQFAADYTYTTQFNNNTSTGTLNPTVYWLLLSYALVVSIISIVSFWRIFQKAGRPGWAILVPFYNAVVELQIVGINPWWLLLILVAFIPIIGGLVVFAASVYLSYRYALVFGKGVGFTVLLVLLPFIGYPMLAFGDAKYRGPNVPDGSTV